MKIFLQWRYFHNEDENQQFLEQALGIRIDLLLTLKRNNISYSWQNTKTKILNGPNSIFSKA